MSSPPSAEQEQSETQRIVNQYLSENSQSPQNMRSQGRGKHRFDSLQQVETLSLGESSTAPAPLVTSLTVSPHITAVAQAANQHSPVIGSSGEEPAGLIKAKSPKTATTQTRRKQNIDNEDNNEYDADSNVSSSKKQLQSSPLSAAAANSKSRLNSLADLLERMSQV